MLYLAAFIPFPEDDGDKIRAMATLRELTRMNSVYAFFLDPEGRGRVPKEVRRLCRASVVVPVSRFDRVRGATLALMRNDVMHAWAFWSAAAQRRLAKAISHWPVTGVHVHRLRMMPYAEKTGLPYVLDLTDCLSHHYSDPAHLKGWRRAYSLIDGRALAKAERRWANRAAACLTVTAIERRHVLDLGVSTPVFVAPNGLDFKRWKMSRRARCNDRLLFMGNLGYPPNVEGLKWFLDGPAGILAAKHPGIVLDVVGVGAPADLARCAASSALRVNLLGYQPDVRPYLWRSTALVCPLPVASGLQNKIVQAMACGLPVVTTPNAATAIAARHRVHLLTAKNHRHFAREVTALLEDAKLRRRIARSARLLVERSFTQARTRSALAAAGRALVAPGRGRI